MFSPSLRMSGSSRIVDLHKLMRCVYKFWYHKGVWNAFVARMVDVANCAVLWYAVFFLGTMLNWQVVLHCVGEGAESCAGQQLVHSPRLEGLPGEHYFLLIVFLIAAAVATLYELWRAFETFALLSEIHEMVAPFALVGYITPLHSLYDFWHRYRAFGEDYEQISISDLPDVCDMPWSEFLMKFCERVKTNKIEGILCSEDFDELRAVQYLMIYDNFYIQLHHREAQRDTGLDGADDNLVQFLVEGMFDEFNSFDSDKQDQLIKLRRKLLLYIVAHVALYPFIISFFIVKVLVKNVAQLRSNPTEYFSREWVGTAKWVFRLYNEVEHITAARLHEGREIANSTLKKSAQPPEVFRFIQRLSSTIVLGVVVLSFINSYLLTSGVVAGRTLFWWLSAGLVGYSTTSGESPARREYNHLGDLARLTHVLHYDRPEWYGSASRFTHLLKWDLLHTRLYVLASAIIRTLLMPLILVRVYTDQSLPRLIEFMSRHSVRVKGVGAMAEPASFDAERNNSESSAAVDAMEDQSIMSFEFKKERSMASFAAVYEKWHERNSETIRLVSPPDVQGREVSSDGRTSSLPRPGPSQFATAHDREQLLVSHVDDSWILHRREFVVSDRTFIPAGGYGGFGREMQQQ